MRCRYTILLYCWERLIITLPSRSAYLRNPGKTASVQTLIQPVFQCRSLLRDWCSSCKHPPASLSTFYRRFPHAERRIRETSCSQIQHEKIQVNFPYCQLELKAATSRWDQFITSVFVWAWSRCVRNRLENIMNTQHLRWLYSLFAAGPQWVSFSHMKPEQILLHAAD